MAKPFKKPVVVWLDPEHTEFGVRLINDVPEGLSALHRHGLDEALRTSEAPLWHAAAGALVLADVEPSSVNLQGASEALLRLVKRIAPIPGRVRLLASPRNSWEKFEALLALPHLQLVS